MSVKLSWATAITTVPARPTMEGTVRSLMAAGFVRSDGVCEVFTDTRRVGPLYNFTDAVRWIQEYDAGAYAIFQDDVIVTPGLREHLEQSAAFRDLLETDSILSLYTAAANSVNNANNTNNWHEITELPKRAYGALAYVIPRRSIIPLSRYLDDHETPKSHGVDFAVGRFCRDRGFHYWTHSPSFVMHTGVGQSVIRDDQEDRDPRVRQCGLFVASLAGLANASDGREG